MRIENASANNDVLQDLVITINDVVVFDDDFVSLSLNYDINVFGVNGSLIIRDTFDMSKLTEISNNTLIYIYYVDIHGTKFLRTFKTVGFQKEEYDGRFEYYKIMFIDDVSYEMMSIFSSKSFNDSPANVLKSYFTQYDFKTIFDRQTLSLDFQDMSSRKFLIPQSTSFLNAISREITKDGYRLWQTRDKIKLTKNKLSDYEVVKNPTGDEVVYTNNTSNTQYGFYIKDYSINLNSNLIPLVDTPTKQTLKFDVTSKTMVDASINIPDMYNNLKLNTNDFSNISETKGSLIETTIMSDNSLELYLEKRLLDYNTMDIIVPGNNKYNEIGKVINVSLRGNILGSDTTYDGDIQQSGYYLITKIQDKIVGKKLFQNLTLQRFDNNKQRK